MCQMGKLCFDGFAIADIATHAAIAAEATGFIEDRHATSTQPGIAIGAAAQILDIAERNMSLDIQPMGLDHLGIDPGCHDLAAGLAVVPLGWNPDQVLYVRREPSEPVLRIGLPEPV